MKAEQGDLLRISNVSHPVIVVSNNFINEQDLVIVCAVAKNAVEGPLHIRLQTPELEGIALCEQIKLIDLKQRRFSKIGAVLGYDVMNISDAVMGMFDYQQL
jgi:mRNA-degrading endonuclease toxin of MazEF toxin-antitoxin module